MIEFKGESLFIEDLSLESFGEQINLKDPVFVYSENALRRNVENYLSGLAALKCMTQLNFSMKSNFNPAVIRILKSAGVTGLTTVSGGELDLAAKLEFNSEKVIFNGNGKVDSEVKTAIERGHIINVDSWFDYKRISTTSRALNRKCQVLIRINPNIDPKVHQYNTTASGKACKFGVIQEDICGLAQKISEDENLSLLGIHCHLGSTINNLEPIRLRFEIKEEILNHKVKLLLTFYLKNLLLNHIKDNVQRL